MDQAYSCKRLAPSDITIMKGLLAVFGAAFEDVPTYQGNIPSDAYLSARLGDGNCIVIVAQHRDAVVGGLVANVLHKLEQEPSEIYLYDLAVDERHRRQGIATRLIEELRTVGKRLGAYVIFVQADAVDEPAIKLYESLSEEKESPYHFDILVD